MGDGETRGGRKERSRRENEEEEEDDGKVVDDVFTTTKSDTYQQSATSSFSSFPTSSSSSSSSSYSSPSSSFSSPLSFPFSSTFNTSFTFPTTPTTSSTPPPPPPLRHFTLVRTSLRFNEFYHWFYRVVAYDVFKFIVPFVALVLLNYHTISTLRRTRAACSNPKKSKVLDLKFKVRISLMADVEGATRCICYKPISVITNERN